jgi:hypothetical protein
MTISPTMRRLVPRTRCIKQIAASAAIVGTSFIVLCVPLAAANAIGSGFGAAYWNGHTVILATIEAADPLGKKTLTIRPLGTLSGSFDAGETASLSYHQSFGYATADIPTARKNILLTLAWNSNSGQYDGADSVRFMGAPYAPYRIVKDFADPSIVQTLRAIRVLRANESELTVPGKRVDGRTPDQAGYWRRHAIVYAQLDGVIQTGLEKTPPRLEMIPALTISGTFDAGFTTNLSAHIDAANLGPHFQMIKSKDNVLVLLTVADGSYSVSTERAAFMPGDHAPICEVKDFDDPKVKDTLTAVQKLRGANAKDANAKQ